MGKTIVITNRKGGTGKSTTAANLGIGLARQGKSVLILDADSQSSLTISLGVVEPNKLTVTLATMMSNIINETEYDPTDGIKRICGIFDRLTVSRPVKLSPKTSTKLSLLKKLSFQ